MNGFWVIIANLFAAELIMMVLGYILPEGGIKRTAEFIMGVIIVLVVVTGVLELVGMLDRVQVSLDTIIKQVDQPIGMQDYMDWIKEKGELFNISPTH